MSVNGKDHITLSGDVSIFLSALKYADGNNSYEDIINILSMDGFELNESTEVLKFAIDENILKENDYWSLRNAEYSLDLYSYEKWDRQIRNFMSLPGIDAKDAISFQQKIQDSHVCILGVGGVGSYLSLSFSMMGVGNISIIDFDSIELSNTSRQVLYTEKEIGLNKIDVAKTEIIKHNPRTKVAAVNKQIKKDVDLVDALEEIYTEFESYPDLLLVAADTPRDSINFIVDEVCSKLNISHFNLGPTGFHQIMIGPLCIPGKTRSYTELIGDNKVTLATPDIENINKRMTPNIMDSFNALAAKSGAIEAIKHLTGYCEPAIIEKFIILDTFDWSVNIHEF